MGLRRKQLENHIIWGEALKSNQLVYAMQQVHYLKVAGMPREKTAYYNLGICLGISSWWIVLRKHGKDYPHRDFICNEVSLKTLHLQEEYENTPSMDDFLNSLGLYCSETRTLRDWSELYKVIPQSGRFALYLSNDHAMALFQDKGFLHFLDPNFGHFRFNSVGALQKILSKTGLVGKYTGHYTSYHLF